MFERMIERARGAAQARARVRARALAERLRAELPPGIRVQADDESVRLAGRGLLRRLALDARLRVVLQGLGR